MVNVKNLFGMAVMATALVACSSNDDLASNGHEGNQTGEAYASFRINLPTTSGTRVAGDPTFDGGDAKEYEVKNGTILIFDNAGKFVTSAKLGTMNPWTDVKVDGVTTAAIATVKLSDDVTVGGDYQALVLLNDDAEAPTPKVTLPTKGTPYATWSADASNVNAEKYASTDGIFMANAPKYNGATSEPTTLVKVNNICASREEAQAKAATTVYVERGLAKVTMQNYKTGGYEIADGTTYAGDKVVITDWKLDVTNKSTYPVHQTGGLLTAWDQIWGEGRFFDNTSSSFKRVYWGEDPNYSGKALQNLTACKDAFNMIKNSEVEGQAGTDHPQYCLENTFDLANMMQGQTTRVVFKAVYTPKALVGKTEKTFYKIGNNTAIWTKADLEQQIKTVALTVMGITDATEQDKYGVDLSKGSNISGKAGQHLIAAENITFNKGTGSTTSKVSPDVVDKINAKLGLTATTGISTYLNGEAYYIARIKHFNELTHWTAGTPYNGDNKAFLGRYGVLRNNWYDLSVNSISGLGYPEVPEVKPTVPDDENDQYINVEVKILDWAKRSQSIDL
jgi:hypothetical protein|uniref:Mfa1 family fimbria major subunit n=1 Tax=Prevotella sp. TaxID=59823 RepID=UPI0040280409